MAYIKLKLQLLTKMQIGAGVDSFFEYAFKAHIFLSDSLGDTQNVSDGSSADFLLAWISAHSGIKRHIYRGSSYEHPHYIQVDINTGAARAFSIDSLSAFFPGLLTLAGQLEEAVETHLLFTALWTRFSSLPEKWSALSGSIEKGMGWWIGRPEFIESTWYLYRATQDPWYLHVGEMALKDIKRRCWTPCGWAGLRDIRTGEKGDRMESFFLGETIKYLFLLFDPKHPLNSLDAPFVFTTEAHPLIIPKDRRKFPFAAKLRSSSSGTTQGVVKSNSTSPETCPIPPKPVPLTYSAVASRHDLFHAAFLARLKLNPPNNLSASPLFEFTVDHPSTSSADIQSPSNYSFYPWTLPRYLIPPNGKSSPLSSEATFDLSFPHLPDTLSGVRSLVRVQDGLLINSVSGLRFCMVKERLASENVEEETFRVQTISNTALGRDEKVYIPHDRISTFDTSDPYFTQIRDSTTVELLLEFDPESDHEYEYEYLSNENDMEQEHDSVEITSPVVQDRESFTELEKLMKRTLKLSDEEFGQAMDTAAELGMQGTTNSTNLDLRVLEEALAGFLDESVLNQGETDDELECKQAEEKIDSNISTRSSLLAYFSTGPGSAAIPDSQLLPYKNDGEGDDDGNNKSNNANEDTSLPWTTIYLSDETCSHRLPASVPRHHQVIVMKRGGCTFSQKLQNIPAFAPSPHSLHMVIVVSYPERHTTSACAASDKPKPSDDDDDGDGDGDGDGDDDDDDDEDSEIQFIRPLLEKMQVTPGGLTRTHPIPLVMVDGGDEGYDLLRHAKSIGMKRRWHIFSQGLRISNVIIT